MYLMKYIAVALVFFAALLYAIRTCRSTSLSGSRGKLSRAVLSLLVLALLGVVWYYSGDKHFSGIRVKYIARTASLLLYLYALPDIWADGKAAATPADTPPANTPPADTTSQAEAAQTNIAQTKDETDRV